MTKVADFDIIKLPNLISCLIRVSQSENLGISNNFQWGIFSKNQNSVPSKLPKLQFYAS